MADKKCHPDLGRQKVSLKLKAYFSGVEHPNISALFVTATVHPFLF